MSRMANLVARAPQSNHPSPSAREIRVLRRSSSGHMRDAGPTCGAPECFHHVEWSAGRGITFAFECKLGTGDVVLEDKASAHVAGIRTSEDA